MISIPYYETSYFAFSNFSAHKVLYLDRAYPTAEHAYHAQKFDDVTVRNRLVECGSPLEAWELAHQLRPRRRGDWDDVKVKVLTDIIRAKTQQHPEVRDLLLATGEEEIIEVNPNDSFWGSGTGGNGQNHTGRIWMKIRGELKT